MKKRLLSILLVLSMVLGLLPGTVYAANSTHPFTDVNKTDWFSDAVEYVYQNGLMYGTEDTVFSSDSPITRGQIVTILHRLEETPSSTGTTFTDVPDGEYYAKAVAWASANGIMSGYGDGRFGPADPITREQLASTMYRYSSHKEYDTTITGNVGVFSDSGTVSSYALDAVNWTLGVGLFSGMGNNTFAPTGGSTRAQAASVLMRFCENMVSSGGDDIPNISENYVPADYFASNSSSGIIESIPATKSLEVPTEAAVKGILENRRLRNIDENGNPIYPITYDYNMSGEYVGDTDISGSPTEKHPMYQTFYQSKAGEMWVIYVVNGEVFANPLSFNFGTTGLDAEVLVIEESNSGKLTSYYGGTNSFYVTIPKDTAVFTKAVEEITADTLDKITINTLCELTGATQLAFHEDDSNGLVAAFSLDNLNDSTPASAGTKTVAADDPIIVVSLGDSFSSGEGIPRFYGQDPDLLTKMRNEDWLAHRSTKSWPSQIEIPGVKGTMADYRVEPGATSTAAVQWYFGAVSGAETKHFKKEQQSKDALKKTGDHTLFDTYVMYGKLMPFQLDIFDKIQGDVDYVTLTIGGNDVGFTDVITAVAKNCSFLYVGFTPELEGLLKDLWDNIDSTMEDIEQVYKAIENRAPQAAIIVAGYPKLLDKNGRGLLINWQEALWVNTKISEFNDKIEELVRKLSNSGMNIYFVDVEEEFDKDGGHQAYSKEAWLNPIIFGTRSEDLDDTDFKSAYSMHPNATGAEHYANCVNAMIRQLEDEKTDAHSISGLITVADRDTDMTNNLPLAGANIKLDWYNPATVGPNPQGGSAVSDNNGNFRISDLIPGRYSVTVSKDGYHTVTDVVTISGEDATYYNAALEAIHGDTVTPSIMTCDIYHAEDNTYDDYGEIVGTATMKILSDKEAVFSMKFTHDVFHYISDDDYPMSDYTDYDIIFGDGNWESYESLFSTTHWTDVLDPGEYIKDGIHYYPNSYNYTYGLHRDYYNKEVFPCSDIKEDMINQEVSWKITISDGVDFSFYDLEDETMIATVTFWSRY